MNRRVQLRVSIKDVNLLGVKVINRMAQILLVAIKLVSAVTNAASAAHKNVIYKVMKKNPCEI